MTFFVRLAMAIAISTALFFTALFSTVAMGSEQEEAIQKGRDALSSQWNPPWYDSQADALRPIKLKAPSRSNWDARWLWDLFRMLGWIALAFLLGGLAYVLIVAFLRRETSDAVARVQRSPEKYVLSSEAVEALPMGAEIPVGDLLAAARQCYQQGDFQRAIVLLFSHQLVQLDRHHLLRLTKGKTNRQYLREIHRQGPSNRLVPLVEKTMLLFERAFFGRHKPSREQFESCWTQLDAFDSMLAIHAEATA